LTIEFRNQQGKGEPYLNLSRYECGSMKLGSRLIFRKLHNNQLLIVVSRFKLSRP